MKLSPCAMNCHKKLLTIHKNILCRNHKIIYQLTHFSTYISFEFSFSNYLQSELFIPHTNRHLETAMARYVSGHKLSQNGIHRTVTYFTRHAHLDDIFKMAENTNSDEITDEVLSASLTQDYTFLQF